MTCYCSGFGQQLARPLFRERHSPDMSEDEAVKLLHEGLRVWLFSYRSLDCLSAGKTWWNADHIWLKAKADVRVQMKCRQTIFANMVKLIGSVA